jgi:quinol monooxygenase YgiN
VYVVEVWADEASANAALQSAHAATATRPRVTDVLAMRTDQPQRIDFTTIPLMIIRGT